MLIFVPAMNITLLFAGELVRAAMQLGLLLTYHCNAQCEHCCVDAGPKQYATMSEADVRSYIDQAAAIDVGVSALCLSGGEALIYFDLVVKILEYAFKKFNVVSLITNCFWATTEQKAVEKLQLLKAAGLDTLVISASPFHATYVDPRRVRIAIGAAERVGLRTFVKVTTPNGGPSIDEILNGIGPLPADVEVDVMPFLPGGRASTLPPSSFIAASRVPEGKCPGAVLTIHPNGDVYFCCTPGAKTDALKLGNAKTSPIYNLVQKNYLGGLYSFLREVGPSGFVPALCSAGLKERVSKDYVDVCHFCTSILTDPDALEVVKHVADQHEAKLFASIAKGAIDHLKAPKLQS